MWNINKISELCQSEEVLFDFLEARGLVKKSMKCTNCGWDMKKSGGNWIFHKTLKTKKGKKRCRHHVSIKKGSWFDKTKLSYETVLKLTCYLIYNTEQKTIARELNISTNTVSQWNTFIKQVLIESIQSSSEILGGPGKIVEIDESKFGRRKYSRGQVVEGQWVFGGVERGSNKFFLVPASDRNSETLVTIIKTWILPGTTIISDCWNACENLDREGYTHLTINHSLNFVNPDSGAHPNSNESMWRHLKDFLLSYGRKKENFVGYLAHYMFIKSAKVKQKDVFDLILEEISSISFDDNVCFDLE